MRILIATQCLPWPLNTGGNAAQFSVLKCLEQDHEFVLVAPIYDEAGRERAIELQAKLPQVKLRAIFCGSQPTAYQWSRDAARRIAIWARKHLKPKQVENPERRPIYHFESLPYQIINVLAEEIERGVDLCQAEFAEMLSLGSWLPKEVPKLFIHHQIHAVYSRRFIEINGRDPYIDYLDSRWNVHERASLEHFDGVVTFSELDSKALAHWIPSDKLFLSPFPIPSDICVTDQISGEFDGRFVFLASGEHLPNRDALEWLLSDIWPIIKLRLPSCTLVVIGKWPEEDRARLSAPGVVFTGFVESLAAQLPGAIMLVPLRIGSGIRVKILAGMAQGVPVISTSVGAEGLTVNDNQEILIRDGAPEFAAAAITLAENSQLWRSLANAGRNVVVECYSPQRVRCERNAIYAKLTGESKCSNKDL